MQAGTLAVLEEPCDDPLESYGSGGFATLDVEETQEGLDGEAIQSGAACAVVEGSTREIYVDGSTIDVEQVGTTTRVYTEWVADVTDAGFIAAESTAGGDDPPFPFDMFRARCGTEVTPVAIDTESFLAALDDDTETWFEGRKDPTSDENEPDDVSMAYGPAADGATAPNVGVGFKTPWDGRWYRGVVYASGYVALFNQSVGPVQYGAFVRDCVLPHCHVPEGDEFGEQATLDGDDEFTDEVEQHLSEEGLDVETDVEAGP